MAGRCLVCSKLKDGKYALQKFGSDDNTFLPEEVYKLRVISDLNPCSSRKMYLKQCPECGAFYLYETEYEFPVCGSEDEQTLTRLSDKEALKYLNENK
jgi:hypothetical protein